MNEGAPRKLSTEEVQDAQIGLLEWEMEERDKTYAAQAEAHGIEPLTGLKTRQVLETQLANELRGIEANKRKNGPTQNLALIMIDIDHFKRINDTAGLGHSAGDEVLRKIGALLNASVRATDTVARWGGEEIMILMRKTSLTDAANHAEELRQKIEALTFEEYPTLKVTASFGVASSESSHEPKKLLQNVDSVLYVAKRGDDANPGGRNVVRTYA